MLLYSGGCIARVRESPSPSVTSRDPSIVANESVETLKMKRERWKDGGWLEDELRGS